MSGNITREEVVEILTHHVRESRGYVDMAHLAHGLGRDNSLLLDKAVECLRRATGNQDCMGVLFRLGLLEDFLELCKDALATIENLRSVGG